jgi:hypothetical protein
MSDLQKFKDAVSRAAHQMTKGEAHAAGVCVKCKEDWKPRTHSEAGRKEYQISGLCEECFDNMFKE